MSDNNFVDGIIFKLPTENAPDFIKGKLSINLTSFAKWVKEKADAAEEGSDKEKRFSPPKAITPGTVT